MPSNNHSGRGGSKEPSARFSFQNRIQSTEGGHPPDPFAPSSTERRRKDLAVIAGGEERFQAVVEFAEQGFGSETHRAERKQEKLKLDDALKNGPLDAALPALQRLERSYKDAMGPAAKQPIHPDPLNTAHLPYLTTDQLVADKKRQKKENQFEPATHLNDAIDPALCINRTHRPPGARP